MDLWCIFLWRASLICNAVLSIQSIQPQQPSAFLITKQNPFPAHSKPQEKERQKAHGKMLARLQIKVYLIQSINHRGIIKIIILKRITPLGQKNEWSKGSPN